MRVAAWHDLYSSTKVGFCNLVVVWKHGYGGFVDASDGARQRHGSSQVRDLWHSNVVIGSNASTGRQMARPTAGGRGGGRRGGKDDIAVDGACGLGFDGLSSFA